jgi:hypothetical protein
MALSNYQLERIRDVRAWRLSGILLLKTTLTSEAILILSSIIDYLLNNPDLWQQE